MAYTNTINGVASYSKVNGVLVANIEKVNGVGTGAAGTIMDDNFDSYGTSAQPTKWDVEPGFEDVFIGDNGDPPNTEFWTNTGMELQGWKLNGVTTGGTNKYVRTKYFIDGDFDVQVKYDLNTAPSTNSWFMQLMVIQHSLSSSTEPIDADKQMRVWKSYEDELQFGICERDTTYDIDTITDPDQDTSGYLRLKRVDDTFTAYYSTTFASPHTWVQIGDTKTLVMGDVDVVLHLESTAPTLDASFDNYEINRGTLNFTDYAAEVSTSRLEYYQTGGPDDYAYAQTTYRHKMQFPDHSEFDIAVDFNITTMSGVKNTDGPNMRLGYSKWPTSFQSWVEIQNSHVGRIYQGQSDQVVPALWTTTTDDVGSLRIKYVLVGTANPLAPAIFIYYWDNARWEWDGDTDGYELQAGVHNGTIRPFLHMEMNADGTMDSYFDNFRVLSADGPITYPIEPGYPS